MSRENDGQLVLVVSDNGVGIPADVDFRLADTLGLKLVTTLTEHQSRGTVELNRRSGTSFKIRFADPRT